MDIINKLVNLEFAADEFGFKWEEVSQILAQIRSECDEINEHLIEKNIPGTKLQEEIGDLLHAAFSLCVFCKFDPQQTLAQSIDKFERRLNAVKQIANAKGITSLQGYSFSELMSFWNEAKKQVG